MQSADGLYPRHPGATNDRRAAIQRQWVFTVSTVNTTTFYVQKLTMSGAKARTMALATAYVKCTSPGAVLRGDELSSCEHQKEGRDGGDGRQTRRHGVIGAAERENMDEHEATTRSVGKGFVAGGTAPLEATGPHSIHRNIPRKMSRSSIRANTKQAFSLKLCTEESSSLCFLA